MRKYIVALLVIVSAIALVGCQKDVVAEPVDVTIVDTMMTFNQIEVSVVVPVTLASQAGLVEIANSIASQTYESYFETIGFDEFTLTINLYSSQAQFDAETMDLGSMIFKINDSMEAPGLSLLQDNLVDVTTLA